MYKKFFHFIIPKIVLKLVALFVLYKFLQMILSPDLRTSIQTLPNKETRGVSGVNGNYKKT